MLTEPQIQRYGRHVLLPKVGGRGQAKLLAATVRVDAQGPEAGVALAYLAAAGVRVDAPADALTRAAFLAGAPLHAFNPDAAALPGPPSVHVCAGPAEGDGARVILRPGGWAFVPVRACPACAQASLAEVEAAPGLVGGAVTVGAAAALRVLQHLCELVEPVLEAAVLTEGGWRALAARACPHR